MRVVVEQPTNHLLLYTHMCICECVCTICVHVCVCVCVCVYVCVCYIMTKYTRTCGVLNMYLTYCVHLIPRFLIKAFHTTWSIYKVPTDTLILRGLWMTTLSMLH